MVSWKHIASSIATYLGLSVTETLVSWVTVQGLISMTASLEVGGVDHSCTSDCKIFLCLRTVRQTIQNYVDMRLWKEFGSCRLCQALGMPSSPIL